MALRHDSSLMNNPLDEEWQRTTGGISPRLANAVRAMRVDLAWLHAAWTSLLFADGFAGDYSVVERRGPETASGAVFFRLWAVMGGLVLGVAYPLFVLGLATRYYARRLDRLSASLGFAGVALLSLVVWGALTAVTYLSAIGFEGFVAVGAAGGVATVSAVLAMQVARRGGRASTILLGYPLGVTAIFLPPVVASLYSPTLASVVFPSSESLAIWLLNNVLAVGGLAAFIRASFELQGLAYVGMWFLLAVPTGWFLGVLATLATGVRRSRETTGNDVY
jgi:hypothetical protein